ncbi:unnamed protein product [Thlaspi arvense]|uniref:Uncharacterized protein n=1 Tax=Thlaspi arvense TaxID=13288 RepID=A0AAU9S3C9_THLAR|nr:unnamed protein product [Thlaspi arvense]
MEAEIMLCSMQAHPDKKHLRDDSFEDYEELKAIYGQNIASGQNAVGLGDPAHADTYQVEAIERTNDMDFAEGIIQQQASEHEVFSSSSEKRKGEKLPQRKKARTDSYNMNIVDDEVTEISSQIFGMIQKRW